MANTLAFKDCQSSRTSSEDAASAAGDKAFLLSEEKMKQFQGPKRRCMSWRNVFFVLNVLFLIAGLTVWAHLVNFSRSLQCNGSKADNFEPDLVYDTPVTFRPYKALSGEPSNETNALWESFLPNGQGMVEIRNEDTANLPPSKPAPHKPETHKLYGVSMFHQLHCVSYLRLAYWPDLLDEKPEDIVSHRDHCLDYIRQAIMCAGDVTFEPLDEAGVHGMGTTHRCRNFERIFSWTYERRSAREDEGITAGHKKHIHVE
ncbi:hypothetical protein MPH_06448 [Macrophomina phaseolina MS6]|uniref:Tat pathway signal sequence n=2 Tax=Macrophomina phaseolina TaxID=35725 RepID=K2R256_MACPH|nr:hypothetical protein MPH_06448 [Macrophomina phaseolina MS6]KAH7032169.1 hypothetical protein B0J12DRAFT_721640 [Macrophomina phaseolina]